MSTKIYHKHGNAWKDTQILTTDNFSNIELGKTEDLNKIQTPGYYLQPVNVNTSFDHHYPVLLAGLLTVKGYGIFTYQTYQTYNSPKIYIRSRYEETTELWFDWRLISGEHLLWSGSFTNEGAKVQIKNGQLKFYRSLRIIMNGNSVHVNDINGNGTYYGSLITQTPDHSFYFMQITITISGEFITFTSFGERISSADNTMFYSSQRPTITEIWGIAG